MPGECCSDLRTAIDRWPSATPLVGFAERLSLDPLCIWLQLLRILFHLGMRPSLFGSFCLLLRRTSTFCCRSIRKLLGFLSRYRFACDCRPKSRRGLGTYRIALGCNCLRCCKPCLQRQTPSRCIRLECTFGKPVWVVLMGSLRWPMNPSG